MRLIFLTGVFALVLLAWLIWGTYKYPETFWAPGNLSYKHNEVKDCGACHQAFKGATSSNCKSCHNQAYFAERLESKDFILHSHWLTESHSCIGCHTEHRGESASITVGILENPHGDFVFSATHTRNCDACHEFNKHPRDTASLRNNFMVWWLMAEGGKAHKPGAMAVCNKCHEKK